MSALKIESPIYLLESTEKCYRCGVTAPVVALACFKMAVQLDDGGGWEEMLNSEELILISNVVLLPPSILDRVQEIHPFLKKRFSRTANTEYLMNVCPECNVHFGDFYLHCKPDGAFFPMDEDAAARIKIRDMKFTGIFEIDATSGMGVGGLIWSRGKK